MQVFFLVLGMGFLCAQVRRWGNVVLNFDLHLCVIGLKYFNFIPCSPSHLCFGAQ